MPAPIVRLTVPLVAVLLCFAEAQPSAAFSQIGTESGNAARKEGIFSVPLPPLGQSAAGAGDAAPKDGEKARSGGQTPPSDGIDAGVVKDEPPAGPGVPEDEPPARPTTAPPAADPQGAPAAPSRPVDPSGTDAGEDETPPGAADMPSSGGADETAPPATASPSAGGENDGAPVDETLPPAEILYGEDGLPPQVRDLRRKLIEIARGGNIEALRPYIEPGEDGTMLSFGGVEGDPIDFLKSASGDGEGVEILAILLEIMEAGHVRNDPATDNEIFVWPYFTAVPIDKLTNPQKVELFELVTAGDYQEMLGFGAYNFYRAGVSPDGKLQFFVAGD